MAVASGPVKDVTTDFVSGSFEGRVLRPTDAGPEDRAVFSETILLAAARGTCPVVFSEMSLCFLR